MLFNSFQFIFVFLPITCILFFIFARKSRDSAVIVLTLASLAFYAYWKVSSIFILLTSMTVNFLLAEQIASSKSDLVEKKTLLKLGISVNLLALIYYKYSGFLVSNLGLLFGKHWVYSRSLPLGISFFTFTQIAYLVDIYRNEAKLFKPLHYGLFVTYFPHLIAGPILHHSEMHPQFNSQKMYQFRMRNFAVGMTIFTIGLFKKVVLADSIAAYVDPVFAGPLRSASFVEAWGGALAYTFQIYFDFSGYSDMAIGLSRLLGVQLPINFSSPYKSRNVIEFWRTWHITLSRFLRDYLYIPLGGNRKGPARRYVNLLVTMLLGGLWHGAGWTFVIWGFLHGMYLIINHGWQKIVQGESMWLYRSLSHKITFVAVIFAWIFFRADSVERARGIIWSMLGGNGFAVGPKTPDKIQISFTALLFVIVWTFPNTQEWMAYFRPGIEEHIEKQKKWRIGPILIPSWKPAFWSLMVVWAMAVAYFVKIHTSSTTEFIYYNF